MAKKLRETLKIIEKYKKANPHYEELLDILGEMLILREEVSNNVKTETFTVDENLLEKKMAGGLPLIDIAGGSFDLSQPKAYFLSLLNIAERRAPEETRQMIQEIHDGSLNFEQMIRDSFHLLPYDDSEDSEDSEDDETLDLIDLFIEESLRPFLEKVAERYGDMIAKSTWSEGYCPICGNEPRIGEIREEEGRRYLFCNQCGFEWKFRRIKCPFCGNEEQQSLAYFTVEGEEKCRVDVCNVCRRYVKIVDFRSREEEANLDVEDIATLHLDILANEEGYH
jgi:FdhE protein